METASTYFTRRAREERNCAADASSAIARSAHLELALRLVSAAVNAVSGSRSFEVNPVDVRGALRNAFPVPANAGFQNLLAAVDRALPRA